jgi:transcriptional regulator with XRE-family HTH domain
VEKKFVKGSIAAIAARLAEERRAKGISQERLAELTGLSVSTIKFIEQSQRAPSLPVLLKLIYVLDRAARLWT